ncbi:MAG: sodium/proton-translocating pyrophosphatase, partial [bacterium]|nr:sodium/proton-translocating pyrophosphatase [bacterium]
AGYIRDGAMAFLKREYKALVVFVIVVAALLGWMNINQEGSSSLVALSFAFGAFCSGLSGYFGMKVATKANVRTTQAAKTGLPKALGIAFSGGTVMGMSVVGLGLAGLALLFLLYTKVFNFGTGDEFQMSRLLSVISGFSLGASSIALFARVGGGIYTKAADVGADLVGKIEAGIPEDDPRNPAVIADNVGDNVGDVAGMGADLFESYVGAIVGAMVLGVFYGINLVMLPLALAALGIIVSILGTFAVRMKDDGDAQKALNLGTFGAGGLAILMMYPVTKWLVPQAVNFSSNPTGTLTALTAGGIFGAVVVGLLAGIAIGLLTEYYTSESRAPVRNIAKQALTGPATTI